MKIGAVDRAKTGKTEDVGEAREPDHGAFDEVEAEFFVKRADQLSFRRLAGVYCPAETPPMVGIEDVRPRVAQLQQVAPVGELNESRRRIPGPQHGLLGSGLWGRSHALHASPGVPASRLSRPSVRPSQMSFDRSVFAPLVHNFLKYAYSSSHVGSSCTSVIASSGGRPLGSTRLRRMNVEGPHLHSETICAVPRSARMSLVK